MRHLATFFILLCASLALAAPTTQPATRPAQEDLAPVPPDVQALLAPTISAYENLKSLQLSGQISFTYTEEGQAREKHTTFTASYLAPGLFRHEPADQPLVGNTGEKVYGYFSHKYAQADAPKGRFMLAELPADQAQILTQQNLSLVLAISKDPLKQLRLLSKSITKAPDQKIGDQAFAAIHLTLSDDLPATLAIDPATHLIRQVSLDMTQRLKSIGREDLTNGRYTINYTTIKPNADLKPDAFAWAPPANAQDLAAAPQGGDGEEANPAQAMVGKPAPDFTLEDVNGQQVKLSDLKGKVVVLDFWATWCGPCVASMPTLQALHNAQSPNGLRLFCVDVQEAKDHVRDFLKEQKLDLPVLLDAQGNVAKLFQVNAFPTKFIIGRDGIVKKVEIGFGPGSAEQLNAAVEEQLKAKAEKK